MKIVDVVAWLFLKMLKLCFVLGEKFIRRFVFDIQKFVNTCTMYRSIRFPWQPAVENEIWFLSLAFDFEGPRWAHNLASLFDGLLNHFYCLARFFFSTAHLIEFRTLRIHARYLRPRRLIESDRFMLCSSVSFNELVIISIEVFSSLLRRRAAEGIWRPQMLCISI